MAELLQTAGNKPHLAPMVQGLRQMLRHGRARLPVVYADIGHVQVREAGETAITSTSRSTKVSAILP